MSNRIRFWKRTWLVFLAVIVLLSQNACQPEVEGPQPPEILFGQEMCDACGMMIDEPRFAAATLLTNGEYRKFDDLHEMLVYHMENPAEQVAAWFVHDYSSETWQIADSVFFVQSDAIQTPMGGGIVAFTNESDAQAFAAEMQGMVYKFDEIRLMVHAEQHP